VCSALLLGYCPSDFEMVPVTPFTSGTIFIFTFHMRCDSVVRSLYLGIFWASFLVTFLSSSNCHIFNTHVPLLLSRIMTSGLWLWTVLPVYSNSLHSMVTLPSWPFPLIVTCTYQCALSAVTLVLAWFSTHCHVTSGTILLLTLNMLTQCVPLSHQTVDTVCIRCFCL